MATRQQFGLVLILTLSVFMAPSAAAVTEGSISGHVKNAAGKPQMGVAVEVFTSAAASPLRAFTDAKGFYTIKNLNPGKYFVKATADRFLPSIRENVTLAAGTNLLVNLTLNTLAEAIQIVPIRRRATDEEDDWKWTLKNGANRPILRVMEDDGPLVVVSSNENPDDGVLKARVAFIAGSDGEAFNGSDVKTAFEVEQSLFNSGTMRFDGNVGYNAGQANGVLRASYQHQFSSGASPEFAVTVRRFASPEAALRHAALNATSLSVSDSMNLADLIELNYGGELQSIQFRGRVTAFRPFGNAIARLSPNTTLQYSYATSLPTTRLAKGFDSAPADLTESNPRVSMRGGQPQLERATHHELAFSRKLGKKTNLQAAIYQDSFRRTALNGLGDVEDLDNAVDQFLPDVYSSTFFFTGRDFSTNGVRLVAQHKIAESFIATMDYAYGGALTVLNPGENLDGAIMRPVRHHALTGKMSGMIPGPKTRWIASYKWTSGDGAVTSVDAFNNSAGQSDPYLNIFIRQPIPGTGFLPGRMEALIDVRNLLAQGYVPMIGGDGRTLYLVQSPRAFRGGVAFNF